MQIWDPRGATPAPAAGTFCGVLIPGSESSLAPRPDAWMERASEFLADALASDIPVLGVCFGHQLLAHAAGARVETNPSGDSFGTLAVERCPEATDDELLSALPERFAAHESHRDHVAINSLPGPARVLARSERTPVEAVRYRSGAYGVQFHPEFTPEICAAYARLETDRPVPSNSAPEAASLLSGWLSRLSGVA